MQNSTQHSFFQQAQQAVVHHPHLRQREVRLQAVGQGQITLEGSVESYFEKQLAQEALRNIEGIETIVNQLEVAWAQSSMQKK